MYYITETGHDTYVANYPADVIRYALEYASEHGNYSGMEEWDAENMEEWISRELDQTDELDLYISFPIGHEFTVRREA